MVPCPSNTKYWRHHGLLQLTKHNTQLPQSIQTMLKPGRANTHHNTVTASSLPLLFNNAAVSRYLSHDKWKRDRTASHTASVQPEQPEQPEQPVTWQMNEKEKENGFLHSLSGLAVMWQRKRTRGRTSRELIVSVSCPANWVYCCLPRGERRQRITRWGDSLLPSHIKDSFILNETFANTSFLDSGGVRFCTAVEPCIHLPESYQTKLGSNSSVTAAS